MYYSLWFFRLKSFQRALRNKRFSDRCGIRKTRYNLRFCCRKIWKRSFSSCKDLSDRSWNKGFVETFSVTSSTPCFNCLIQICVCERGLKKWIASKNNTINERLGMFASKFEGQLNTRLCRLEQFVEFIKILISRRKLRVFY